ncbi:hypothetical protein CFP56_003119 [Quercus suber]|uniref:R13L1/DRL21-like LRR repeat region domain-containing protein n=1 Tax=Quercus suber TaxID=58331 RepID=A0AAW0LCT1_QUESU
MHGLGYVVDVGEAQNAQLKKRIHLHSLELDFYIEDQFQEKGEESRRRMESDLAVLNVLEPPSHLEKLSIKSFMGTTVYTNWMMSLTNLKSLHIDGCWQLECLPPLGSTWNKIREKHPVVDRRALVWFLFRLLFASNAFISWLTVTDKLPTPDMADATMLSDETPFSIVNVACHGHQDEMRAKFFLSMEECKEWEVAASRDEDILNTLASLARLATRNNSHFTREFQGRALGHMSMDSELPRNLTVHTICGVRAQSGIDYGANTSYLIFVKQAPKRSNIV